MTIEFNTKGYDTFLDFLKAYCILWVVIGHIIPGDYLNYILYPFIGACQVPLFLIIQSFHAFKRTRKPIFEFRKTLKRIIIPFLVIQAVIVCAKVVINSPDTAKDLIINALMGGGYRTWFILFLDIFAVRNIITLVLCHPFKTVKV